MSRQWRWYGATDEEEDAPPGPLRRIGFYLFAISFFVASLVGVADGLLSIVRWLLP